MRRPWVWGLLAAFVGVRLWMFAHYPRCGEDAFITFRTARNLLHFGAPTFNPGEASWPASSPLWLGWCALGLGFWADIEWWAHLGSLLAEVLLIVAVSRLINRRAAIAFGILLALYQPAAAISLSGIEMFAMVAAFAWALLGSRLALALLMCSRPEGIILALVAGWPWRRNWRPLLLGSLVWLVMMVGTGRLMPAGVSAKVGTYGLHAFHGWRWLSLLYPWPGPLEQRSMGVLGLSALLLVWAWRLEGRARVFAACGGGLLLAYFVTGAVYFFWYMTLPICAAMLCLASIPNRMVYVVAILVAALSWTTNYPIRRWQFQYRQLIKVAMQLSPEGTVMMDAIGVAGWQRPQVRFVDVIGLCSPNAESARRSKTDGWLTYLIQDEQPDVVVLKLHELTSNVADAGEGKPFLEAKKESLSTGIVGALLWVRGTGDTLGSGVLGYRPTQIGQDVILKLTEPKPRNRLTAGGHALTY